MLIGRCAWHPQYFGRPLWRGVKSWHGWRVRFTDGICARCLDRFRAEHQEYLERVSSMTAPVPVTAPAPTGVTVPVTASLADPAPRAA